MLYCRKKEKWNEIPYIDLFCELKNNLELRKKCGLLPREPKQSVILALKKDNKSESLEYSCVECCGGKKCQKYDSVEEEIEFLVSPRRRERGAAAGEPPAARDEEGASGHAEGEGTLSPVASRTRNGMRDRNGERGVIQAPLRQAAGAEGPVTVTVPFSVADLRSWKELAGSYREDPEKVAKIFETIIRTQHPDWLDVQVVLDSLLTQGEKVMVLAKAREEAERLHAQNAQPGTLDQHFPQTDPRWDPNKPGHRELLTRYQRLIAFGIRHGIPKAINISKLYQIVQGKDEPPSDFYQRLLDVARKYTNLDPEREGDALLLTTIFVGQSAPDIRVKLQKLEGKILEIETNYWI